MDTPAIPTEQTKSKSPWRRTAVPGMYVRDNGTFYSRYSINGKRTWRSLHTDVFTIAKLRHESGRGGIEVARQSGATLDTDLRNLGALAARFMYKVAHQAISHHAKHNYSIHLKRLRAAWGGEFDTAAARNVTRETVLFVRRRLLDNGYSNSTVNQSLRTLRMLLGIAKQNQVIMSSPFDGDGPFGNTLFLPPNYRRPEIPSNENLERIFAEMERESDHSEPHLRLRYSEFHRNAGEHARFLAYSGCRLEEANALTWDDVKEDHIVVRGTKTETSFRAIPIIPPMRKLLDQLKTRRIAGPVLGTTNCLAALKRACQRLGLPELHQHDLRHYFATACIESGVPVPTVADWLGHADGGALLMRTYRHLRNRHSIEMAQMVTLGAPSPAQSKTA